MRICATIAEFNPFHNGHAYLIKNFSKQFDAVIAIMSGSFVQRGSAAIYDKFSRANAAIQNGCDLVLELPVIYSLSSAEHFATGAVKILNGANCIDSLIFGSETGNLQSLIDTAKLTVSESESFKDLLKSKLAAGLTYPRALAEIYTLMGIDESVYSSPNNILGIEYIRALHKTNSSMSPLTIKRTGAEHDSCETDGAIASASHIRHLIEQGASHKAFLPVSAYPIPVFDRDYSQIILYALKSAEYNDFLKIPDCSAQLASRFVSAFGETTVEGIIKCVKSKNFTESRIRRIIWNLVIKNTVSPLTEPTYIRVLAQNKRGSEALIQIKKHSSLPVVQKGVELKGDKIFAAEVRATDIYNIVRSLPSGEDYRYSPKQLR